jgi:hypothetical protein
MPARTGNPGYPGRAATSASTGRATAPAVAARREGATCAARIRARAAPGRASRVLARATSDGRPANASADASASATGRRDVNAGIHDLSPGSPGRMAPGPALGGVRSGIG